MDVHLKMKLFYIYIGGTIQGAAVELHDVRLVAAETIEGTYDALRTSWWGEPESLHLDCWGALHYADGHKISVCPGVSVNQSKQLYFVNLGGYDTTKFTELHKNVFVVAENPAEAKARAVANIQNWNLPHRDKQFEVEQLLLVNEMLAKQGYSIHLEPVEKEEPFSFTCDYVPIGKM